MSDNHGGNEVNSYDGGGDDDDYARDYDNDDTYANEYGDDDDTACDQEYGGKNDESQDRKENTKKWRKRIYCIPLTSVWK